MRILTKSLMGVFVAASVVQTKTFESTVEIRIDSVSVEERFGASDAPLGPEQAMARELQYLRSDAVVGQVTLVAKNVAVFMAASVSATAVATNWLKLVPSALARRTTSALIELGRWSGSEAVGGGFEHPFVARIAQKRSP